MAKNAFKDKKVSQTQLTPRPRYYDRDGATEFSGLDDEVRSNDAAVTISVEQRREAVRTALAMSYEITDWEVFFREIMSMDGLIHRLFPTQTERRQFETTAEYVEIQHIMAEMRGRRKRRQQQREKTRMITVRLPESLHASLQQEADEMSTSMNKLCISKLLQIIDEQLVK